MPPSYTPNPKEEECLWAKFEVVPQCSHIAAYETVTVTFQFLMIAHPRGRWTDLIN
jgi:hypothetical protein